MKYNRSAANGKIFKREAEIMLEPDHSIVCSACDICHQEKPAELMCTFVVEGEPAEKIEKTCWCVCEDCLPVLEKVNAYYEDAVR